MTVLRWLRRLDGFDKLSHQRTQVKIFTAAYLSI
jgi:hypothetical protein